MKRRNQVVKTRRADVPAQKELCPNCKSDRVVGLVAAFWTNVNGPQDADWRSESEMGSERMCLACEHEWV